MRITNTVYSGVPGWSLEIGGIENSNYHVHVGHMLGKIWRGNSDKVDIHKNRDQPGLAHTSNLR